MPRTTLQRQASNSAPTVVEDAKTKFLDLKPKIDELKEKNASDPTDKIAKRESEMGHDSE